MGILIKKAFAQLLFWLYEFLDAVFEMFKVLCGIESVEYTENGETVSRSIIEIFLQSSAVTKAFLLLFLIAIIVCAVSVIVAVVKNIINMKGGERKSHAKTVGQGFGSIIVTFVLAVIMVLGISGSNELLGKVYSATVVDDSLSISAMLFNMSVSESYVYDDEPSFREVQATDDAGNLLWETVDGKTTTDKNGLNVKKELDLTTGEMVPVIAKTYETYYGYLTVKDDKGNDLKDENGRIIYVIKSGWRGDHTAADIVFGKTSVNEVFGVHRKNMIGLEEADKGYKTKPMVELDSFNIFTAYFVVILVLISLVFSMLGLVKRVFDLVTLFIMLPLISATIPLDDGARLKTWRETVISKVILAFGAVISVNVFMLIIPLINNLSFASLGWSKFLESIFKMFMLIGGALCINGGQLLISRIFGTSAEESREMAQSARALMSGAVAAGGLAHSAKNAIFGGRNKYGKETKGMLRGGAKVAGAATNVAGNVLGGQAYRSVAGKTMGALGAVKDSLKGLAGYKRSSSATTPVSRAASSTSNRSQANGGQQLARAKQVNPRALSSLGGSSKNASQEKSGVFKNGIGGAIGRAVGGVARTVRDGSRFQRGTNMLKPTFKPKGSGAFKRNNRK